MEFTRDYLIRFAHCDPAGIVFYPQYFVLFNDHVEDWFAQALGCDFATLHHNRLLGVPTVHITCDFANPSRLGDIVSFKLAVEKIGGKSVRLKRSACVGNDIRVSVTQVLACVDVKTSKACPWPDDLRAGMTKFLQQIED
ncbi:MAG: thioesterase family protein [Burkholderiaceae bacterium]